MHLPAAFLALCLLNIPLISAKPAKRTYDTHEYYVIEHNSQLSDGASLVDVANALGVELVEQAGELSDHWLVRRRKEILSARGEEQPDSVLQQYQNLRQLANGNLFSRSETSQNARRLIESIPYLEKQALRRRSKRAPPSGRPPSPTSSRGIAARLGIQDPLFPDQWHLVNDESPGHSMNVVPVWDMGFTGKGIITSIIDDGLEYESEDLKDNFDAADSYDFNDHEDLPTPKNLDDHHGTRCAGQVAATKNNACGVGIAHDSKIAGVRILSGPITDVDEASALNYGFQNVSIYSCSWGPPDNGVSMEGPSYLIRKAVVNGVNNGRGGKGSVFVFASGNGAANGDQCNFDGYTNSIYSVTVSAVDYKGQHPYYSEPCAANMIVAYSSGGGKHIVTTDKGKNQCTHSHGGTSAAAPNAVGVFALALQARPDLTWRDIQYLCVETAGIINPDDDWEKIAGGRSYSYKYGFGVLNAEKYVKAAQTWKLVKPQAWFNTPSIQIENGTLDMNGTYSGGALIGPEGVTSTLTVTKDMLSESNFESLEHINIKVWINHTRRGDVAVDVTSPNGIKSMLAMKRRGDTADSGFPGWRFMSVKHWGENPIGDWAIHVSDQQTEQDHGRFLGWNMVFWGSTIDPSRAIKFELQPSDESLFPPIEVPKPVLPPPTSTQHSKPTVPPAEPPPTSTSPATSTSSAPTESKTSIPTGDQGWFPDMSTLITNQKWFFGALGAVAVFGLAAGAYFWRRRMSRMHSNYSALAGEDVSMTGLGGNLTGAGTRTTRELYDAFGEVSDDDDETTALRPDTQNVRRANLGFHSGFLDDDEPSAPLTAPVPVYRDEPDSPVRAQAALSAPVVVAAAATAAAAVAASDDEDEDDEDDEDDDEEEDDDDDEEEESSEEGSDSDTGREPRPGSGNGSSLAGSWEHARASTS